MKEKYKISLIYAVIGLVWIYFSDTVVLFLFDGISAEDLSNFQSYKGFLFILLTTLILYFFLDKTFKSMQDKIDYAQFSEKRFNDIFESTPIPIFLIDNVNYQIINVNQSAVDAYGYTKKELLGMQYTQLINDQIQFIYSKYLKSNGSDHNDPVRTLKHIRKNGEVFTVEERSTDYIENNNLYKVVIAFDLTRIGSVENDLRKSNESIILLEENDRKRFAGELHNGIGQYLVVIKQVSALLSEGNENEKNSHLFKLINESAENALIECKRLTHDLSPKELYNDGLKKLMYNAVDRIVQSMNISIDLDIDERLDTLLNIHAKFQLFRIFQENISNTLKHSKGNRIALQIKIVNNQIYYSFHDDGIGIEEDHLNSESSFNSLKKRVDFLNGKLTIVNSAEGGAMFEIIFPPVYKIVLN